MKASKFNEEQIALALHMVTLPPEYLHQEVETVNNHMPQINLGGNS